MPFKIVREDITRISCDAIVNATDSQFSGSGGVDAAIHKTAGEALRRECDRLGGCRPGEAKLTKGYALPCKYVIHTVGPVWHGGENGEEAVLRACYREALQLAKKRRCQSIAFPLIAAESFGYPKELALHVATDEISRFLQDNDMQVTLAVFGEESFTAGKKLFADIAAFIDQTYVDEHRFVQSARLRFYDGAVFESVNTPPPKAVSVPAPDAAPRPLPTVRSPLKYLSLEDMLKQMDESFSQMLLRKIDERGMTDAQCYKKANIDRKLFSKIRNDKLYKPSKPTALAFAVALELSFEETEELLKKAGFALSHSSMFDVILEYFIRSGNYNIFEINEVLFYYDQVLLGN